MATSERETQTAARFPVKAALAIVTALALLAAAHWWPDHAGNRTRGIDPVALPTLAKNAATVKLPHRPTPIGPHPLPLNGVQQTAKEGSPGVPNRPATETPAATTFLADDSHAMDPFFAQLWALEQHQATLVTVLHYGDSPTTADLITGDVRAFLQERFGDAGHGFNLGAKPWAWYGHRDVDISDTGWASSQKDATGVGKMKQGVYGIGGAIFSGGVGASTTYTLHDAAQTSVVVSDLAAPGAGRLSVSAGDQELTVIDTGAAGGPQQTTVPLPPGTKKVKLSITSGTVKLFGADFRRGDRGILYDSLGLNGATTTVLSRTFDPDAWRAEMQATHPSLLVINYGTNESQFGGLVQTLDKELRLAIEKARAAAPGVPILIMSPMDRGQHSGGDIITNPAIPQIVAIQQKVAAETHCAYFNTYAAMGGDGTMARWYAANPRLITADLIHPTPPGAVIVAQLFVDDIYRGYDRWKRAHGIGVVAVKGPSEVAKERAAAKKKAEEEKRAAKLKADEEKRAAKEKTLADKQAAAKEKSAKRTAKPGTAPAGEGERTEAPPATPAKPDPSAPPHTP